MKPLSAALLAPAALALLFAGPALARARRPAAPPPAPACIDDPAAAHDPLIDGFGCATAANLRLMLADPSDFEAGKPAGPPTGDGALAAVRRYRAGQVKSLGSAGATAPSDSARLAGGGEGQ